MLKRLKIQPQDLLFLLLFFHLVGNIIWIKLNNSPPAWDEAYNTMRSLDYLHFFQNLFTGRLDVRQFLDAFVDYYGPLVRIMTAIILFMLSPHIKLAQFMATLFFLGTIYLVYLLGKTLYKNKWIALFAVFLFSFFQVVYDNSRWLLLDIPMTFFTLLAFYFFIKSNYFENRKYTILSFVATMFSVLTKFQGVLYLLLPYFWGLVNIVKNKKYGRIWNILIGSLIFIIPSVLYVIPSIEKIKLYYGLAVPGEPLVDPIYLLNPITWTHHLKLFINYEITFPIFVFFIVSLYFFIKNKNSSTHSVILASDEGARPESNNDSGDTSFPRMTPAIDKHNYKWFLITNIIFYYIFFTVFPNKDMRFLFPILPFVALVFARGFFFFFERYKKLATAAFIFIAVFNLAMYVILSFEYPIKKGSVYFVVVPFVSDIAIFNLKNYPVLTYDPHIWPQEQIIKDLKEIARDKDIKVVLIPNFEGFNDNNLGIYDRIYRVHNIYTERAGGRTRFESREELDSYLNDYEYFLTTPGEVGVFYQTDKEAFEQMRDALKQRLQDDKAQILKKYTLPNNQEIWLVKRIL